MHNWYRYSGNQFIQGWAEPDWIKDYESPYQALLGNGYRITYSVGTDCITNGRKEPGPKMTLFQRDDGVKFVAVIWFGGLPFPIEIEGFENVLDFLNTYAGFLGIIGPADRTNVYG